MSEVTIYVAGTPRPQPRPRFVNGRVVSTGSAKARQWRARVLAECRAAGVALTGSVAVELDFWFATPRAERWGQAHAARPDIDNLVKPMLDCAERAGVLAKGDARVAQVTARKRWAKRAGAVMVLRAV